MAAKTFTMTDGSRTASQALDADSKVLKITGRTGDGKVLVFISEIDNDFAIGYEYEGPTPHAVAFQIPSGWYVESQIVGAVDTINAKVVIQ